MIQMCIAPTKNFITGGFIHSFIHSYLFTISHIITIKLRKLTKQMARKPERKRGLIKNQVSSELKKRLFYDNMDQQK